MALDLAPWKIHVNAIAPGLTDTAQPRYGSTEEELAARAAAMPLGRMGQPEDIANVAKTSPIGVPIHTNVGFQVATVALAGRLGSNGQEVGQPRTGSCMGRYLPQPMRRRMSALTFRLPKAAILFSASVGH
jgi:hypothetical protein